MMIKTKKKILQLIYYVIFFTGLAGCTSTAEKLFNEQNYTVGSEVSTRQGGIIASELKGKVETERRWVGVMHSEDGWGTAKLAFSNDYIEKKLFYQGYEEPYLYLIYREYKQGNEQPSINKTKKFNPDENPFIELGIFNIKVIGIEGLQADFSLLDKESWKRDQQNFIIAREKQQKEDHLNQIVQIVNSLSNEVQSAKNYAGQFPEMTHNLNSFLQATSVFNDLKRTIDESTNRNYSTDQLIEIFQAVEIELSKSIRFFTSVATTLQSWESMDAEFKKAAQSGMEKQYFLMALDYKNIGESQLQAEQYEVATQMFNNAKQEVGRTLRHSQNTGFGNLSW